MGFYLNKIRLLEKMANNSRIEPEDNDELMSTLTKGYHLIENPSKYMATSESLNNKEVYLVAIPDTMSAEDLHGAMMSTDFTMLETKKHGSFTSKKNDGVKRNFSIPVLNPDGATMFREPNACVQFFSNEATASAAIVAGSKRHFIESKPPPVQPSDCKIRFKMSGWVGEYPEQVDVVIAPPPKKMKKEMQMFDSVKKVKKVKKRARPVEVEPVQVETPEVAAETTSRSPAKKAKKSKKRKGSGGDKAATKEERKAAKKKKMEKKLAKLQ